MGVIFGLGEFELDEGRFELRRLGRAVGVQPKVLRLLLVLVAQRRRTVSEEELMAALWPGQTVGRASITRAVMGARIALGERGQGRRSCIRTVRSYGYQFVGEVRELQRASEGRAGSTAPPAMHEPGVRELARDASQPVLVGRQAALAELDESLVRALAGRGHCVLVVGEPGMGKTRVLEALAERAAAQGARVCVGRCMELEGAPAYWPLHQLLRDAMQGRSDAELHALLGAGAPDVAEGFPELRARLHDLPSSPTIDSVAARFRFFDSTARFLVRASVEQPLVLLLDDLQHADPSSLRLLLFVARQLDGVRLLLVGTARPAEARDREAHARLAELAGESSTRTIALTGWSRSDIARFVELATGAAAPAPVIDRLHEQTAGNPLFVDELVRSLRAGEEGATPHARGDASGALWEGLSHAGQSLGLRGAIERHLSTLSEPCRALLAAGSVLGRELPLGLLAQLNDVPSDSVMAWLSEASAAGIVQSVPGVVGRYRYTHVLIRDALYAQTPPLPRARQHARVAQLLEARGAAFGDDAELAQLAEHFRLAAPAHDPGKALLYARRAAERAMQRLAYEEAAEHLHRALPLLDLLPPDAAQRMQLVLALGEVLVLGGEPARARPVLLQAATLARDLGAIDVIAQAASLLGRSRESGTIDRARVELLREALTALSPGDARAPYLQALLAKALSYSNDHAGRAQLALGALQLAEALRDPVLQTEALHACHEALTEPEHRAERVRIAAQLRRLAHEHGDPRTMVCAHTADFQNGIEVGDVAALEQVVSALDALAQQTRDPAARWYVASYRSTLAMIAGRFELAEQHARDAFALGQAFGEERAYHHYCALVNGIYRLQGRSAEAEAMATDITARFPALAGWRAFLASIHADAGRTELARQTLAQLMEDDLATLRRDPYLLSALCPVAELCVRVGNEAAARSLYEALRPFDGLHGHVSFGVATYGPISLRLAWLALRMRDLSLAERHCERALAEAEAMPSLTFTALACLAYAYALRARPEPALRARAASFIARAQQLAHSAGMRVVEAQCLGLAQSLA